jgi:hypothetical protein
LKLRIQKYFSEKMENKTITIQTQIFNPEKIPRITSMLFIAPKYDADARPFTLRCQNLFFGKVAVNRVIAPQKISRASTG